jgi:hypothetical protein
MKSSMFNQSCPDAFSIVLFGLALDLVNLLCPAGSRDRGKLRTRFEFHTRKPLTRGETALTKDFTRRWNANR